jgi:hypothetical protein
MFIQQLFIVMAIMKKHLEISGLYKMRVTALIDDHPHTL